MDLFIGRQECSIDDKRRWSLPPKYRPLFGAEALASGYTHYAVLIPWYGGSVAVFPRTRWQEIQSRLDRLDYTTPDFLEAKRVCLPRMETVHTDPEGRLTLTPEQLSWLRLKPKAKDRVIVVGVGQYLEIWNAAEWPEVDRTGKNAVTRPAEDLEYDRQLEVLMRAAAEAAARSSPPSAAEGETEGL